MAEPEVIVNPEQIVLQQQVLFAVLRTLVHFGLLGTITQVHDDLAIEVNKKHLPELRYLRDMLDATIKGAENDSNTVV